MTNKFVNNTRDPTQERFFRLEQQVTYMNCNVNLLMMDLRNKFRIFKEEGGSNSKDKAEGRLRDQEEIENWSKKGPKNYQPSSSVMNNSQPLFKKEVKVDIKPYHDKIDALKLNHWLQQLEVYFSVHQTEEE